MLRISTTEDQTWFLPGSVVTGEASWHVDRELESAEVRLFWYTQGKGTQDVEVVDTIRFEAPGSDGSRSFRLDVPQGPYSFSGSLITLAWALELVLDPGGDSERVDLVVGPNPVEISIAHEVEF